jgi:hypothetical protein
MLNDVPEHSLTILKNEIKDKINVGKITIYSSNVLNSQILK